MYRRTGGTVDIGYGPDELQVYDESAACIRAYEFSFLFFAKK